MKKIIKYGLLVALGLSAVCVGLFLSAVYVENPQVESIAFESDSVRVNSPGLRTLQSNWFRQSSSGLYELYVEGKAYERGIANGKLAAELVQNQESYFINQIRKIVPSDIYLNFLKYLVAWFNKDLPYHVLEEYQKEIYGVSQAAADEFDFIGPKYMRILNYHAAHDIGHALQDRNFTVGCTSFGAWGSKTTNGELILGRNFDFYSGDDFAKDKIVCFTNPEKGHPFMYVTWGGMVGVVSGMNAQGLTVTINASKSDYPTSSATPISLLAREILQYATTIEEAYSIAESRQTFVSESLLIGSAADGKATIIEKSPTKIGIKYPEEEQIVCANNYQSEAFENDEQNLLNIEESNSMNRYNRMNELLNETPKISHESAAEILRDRFGAQGKMLGNGNEKAINQLIAHHSIIFKPEQRLVWVSTAPYQLGKYVCYDLKRFFSEQYQLTKSDEIIVDSLTIKADEFLYTEDYNKYERFRKLRFEIARDGYKLLPYLESEFLELNPFYYLTYSTLADYYFKNSDYKSAKAYYKIALGYELDSKSTENNLKSQISTCDLMIEKLK